MTISKAIAEAGLLSTSDVARRLGMDRTTIWLWIKTGVLPAVRKGNFFGVKPEVLKEFQEIYKVLPESRKKRNGKKKEKGKHD